MRNWIWYGLLVSIIVSGLILIEPPATERITNPRLIAAMKYHGVIAAYYENKTWWFTRDGKKCRLLR